VCLCANGIIKKGKKKAEIVDVNYYHWTVKIFCFCYSHHNIVGPTKKKYNKFCFSLLNKINNAV
jgi:hypothetical protein